LVVTSSILGKGRGSEHNRAIIGEHSDHVGLRGNVNTGEAHTTSWRRRKSGASEPVLLPTLVHARTRLRRPRDTVRASSTGRGRQSHSRSLGSKRRHGDPLPVPSASILLGDA